MTLGFQFKPIQADGSSEARVLPRQLKLLPDVCKPHILMPHLLRPQVPPHFLRPQVSPDFLPHFMRPHISVPVLLLLAPFKENLFVRNTYKKVYQTKSLFHYELNERSIINNLWSIWSHYGCTLFDKI